MKREHDIDEELKKVWRTIRFLTFLERVMTVMMFLALIFGAIIPMIATLYKIGII